MGSQPDITLYFLGASRAIRIAWLLEELNLPYKLDSSPRAPNGLAPPAFKQQIGTYLGKSPTVRDGDLIVQESVAITEYDFIIKILVLASYLCETYDPSNRLIPKDIANRAKVREWMSAAEGTFMLHALAILYARWRIPDARKTDGTLAEMEENLSSNVQNDLDWVESELKARGGRFLVGDATTAADIIMAFSLQFIFARKLGTQGKMWPAIDAWLENIQGLESYKRAVQKTGHSLEPVAGIKS